MSTRQTVTKLVADTLEKFIKDFQENPYDFFYEEDARSILYSSLVSRWKDSKMERVSGLKWIHKGKTIVRDKKTIPFKAEYPRSARFDIAYIENKADRDNCYILPVSIAIEVKLGSKATDQSGGFHDDLKKLINYQQEYQQEQLNFTGIALYLYQPTELAGPQDSLSEISWLKEQGFMIENYEKNAQIPEQGVKGYFVTKNHSHILTYNR